MIENAALERTTLARCQGSAEAVAPRYFSCAALGSWFQPSNLATQYDPFHFSLWLSHESRHFRS